MRKSLTPKQQKAYDCVSDFQKREEKPPTLSELKECLEVEYLNSVTQFLNALEEKGYIRRHKHKKRGIELLDRGGISTETTNVPVVASVGCDDLSTFANETYDEYIEVDKELMEQGNKLVAVRAVGDSMNDAGVSDGDYVLVEITEDVSNGDRVAAVINRSVTIKRFERKDNVVVLHPDSTDPSYKPIVVNKDFKVAGKVVCTLPRSEEMMQVVPDEDYNHKSY